MARYIFCKNASDKATQDDIKTNNRKYVAFMKNKLSQRQNAETFQRKIKAIEAQGGDPATIRALEALNMAETTLDIDSDDDSDME